MNRVNQDVAGRLEEAARLLQDQGADRYRVGAYLRAARTIRSTQTPVADPVSLLASAPGIGGVLANRLHEELGLETLADLEAAAHDGRLATVAGFGPKRLAGIRDSLAHRLGRVRLPIVPGDTPTVSELLDVDREYREKAAAGELQRIAPRRFNPSGDAWLPILHTRRGTRRYTALFSNTARAHRTGNARDWVVLYGDNGSGEHRHTVITAGYGPLRGQRVVAGREDEGRAVYARAPARSKPNAGSRRRAVAQGLLPTLSDALRSPGG
jgi:Helix-hairpin-helix domain